MLLRPLPLVRRIEVGPIARDAAGFLVIEALPVQKAADGLNPELAPTCSAMDPSRRSTSTMSDAMTLPSTAWRFLAVITGRTGATMVFDQLAALVASSACEGAAPGVSEARAIPAPAGHPPPVL